MYVTVNVFHQLPVGETGIGLQYHKGNLGTRTENVPTSQTLLRQACFFGYTLKREHGMKPAKFTLMKTLAIFFQNIEFCKAECWLNLGNISYFCHILVGVFPPFWPSNLVFGGIPKDTKKPTNSQYFVYELVG